MNDPQALGLQFKWLITQDDEGNMCAVFPPVGHARVMVIRTGRIVVFQVDGMADGSVIDTLLKAIEEAKVIAEYWRKND